jgi:hypothetical protein
LIFWGFSLTIEAVVVSAVDVMVVLSLLEVELGLLTPVVIVVVVVVVGNVVVQVESYRIDHL